MWRSRKPISNELLHKWWIFQTQLWNIHLTKTIALAQLIYWLPKDDFKSKFRWNSSCNKMYISIIWNSNKKYLHKIFTWLSEKCMRYMNQGQQKWTPSKHMTKHRKMMVKSYQKRKVVKEKLQSNICEETYLFLYPIQRWMLLFF